MEKPKRELTSYNLFTKEWMSKRPANKPPTEWMKQVGKKWRATKSLVEMGKQAKASHKHLEARLKACEERLKACEKKKASPAPLAEIIAASPVSDADLLAAVADRLKKTTKTPPQPTKPVRPVMGISAADLLAAAGRLKKTTQQKAKPTKPVRPVMGISAADLLAAAGRLKKTTKKTTPHQVEDELVKALRKRRARLQAQQRQQQQQQQQQQWL